MRVVDQRYALARNARRVGDATLNKRTRLGHSRRALPIIQAHHFQSCQHGKAVYSHVPTVRSKAIPYAIAENIRVHTTLFAVEAE